MAGIRARALSLLEAGNLTATEIGEKLRVDRNSASHAIARAHTAGEVRIVNYLRTGKDLAPVYGLGGGDDVERPAPLDPYDRSAAYRARHPDRNRASSRAWRERNLEHVLAKQAEYRARRRADATPESAPVEPVESCSQNAVLAAKEHAVSESVSYFEIDLLPGVQHFTCTPYKATLSVQSCADKFKQANSGDAFGRHAHCKRCPTGAAHSGAGAHLNLGSLRSATICGRCHRLATRLIHKHTCISCFNRARELRLGKNGKGTAPVRLAKLDRRSISYRAGGVVKTRVLEESVDMTELVVAVLRDEKHDPQFGWSAPASMDWLRDDDLYDRSFGDVVEVADVGAVADSMQDAQEHAALPIVATRLEDAEADPYNSLRDAIEQLERDPQVGAPTTSRRAAKRLRQHARRQVPRVQRDGPAHAQRRRTAPYSSSGRAGAGRAVLLAGADVRRRRVRLTGRKETDSYVR